MASKHGSLHILINWQKKVCDLPNILFASDNGPHQEGGHKADFFDSNGPMRGTKRDLYEGGIKVPMIAWWPGKIPAGTVNDHISTFWDVLPTVCELTEADIPEEVDGISFFPTLMGNTSEQAEHEFLYWEFYEQGGKQAVRKGPWKYVKLQVRDPQVPIVNELYHLEKDVSESINLVEDQPEIVEEMESIMEQAHTPHPLISLFSLEANAETRF